MLVVREFESVFKPRCNFEIGGGGVVISDYIEGTTRHFFLLTLYNFKNIEGRGGGVRANETGCTH